MSIDFAALPTPCYVVDEALLIKNLEILAGVQKRTGCKILMALKGFSMFSAFDTAAKYLKGTTASSLFEARLGAERFGGETHIFSPAYIDADFDEVMQYCDHIVFNSFDQLAKFQGRIKGSGKKIDVGIRINPEYSEIKTPLYDPCAKGSRLGVTPAQFRPEMLSGVDGLHFHTLCEQNSDALERTVKVVDEKFGKYIAGMKWINLGGGHHITRGDYDVKTLERCVMHFKYKYGVEVYIEPGEAVALNTGFLVATVLELSQNGGVTNAILDTSAACHMPDVLEMPYRPEIIGAGKPKEKRHTYRLGGPTCLAGDVIGDYSFDEPLEIGNRLVFCDMAHYTMVKNNTFNGINLPHIVLWGDGGIKHIKSFGYADFEGRLS